MRAAMKYRMTNDDGSVAAGYGHAMLPIAQNGRMTSAQVAECLRERDTPYSTDLPWSPQEFGWTTRNTAALLRQIDKHDFPITFDGQEWVWVTPTEPQALAVIAAFTAAYFDAR